MPPICMRTISMTWPNVVRQLTVSMTLSPVTQTADVAVKSASNAVSDPWLDRGSISRPLPMIMKKKKLAAKSTVGLTFCDKKLMPMRDIS